MFVPYALFVTAVSEGRRQRGLDPANHLRLTMADIGLDDLVSQQPPPGGLGAGPVLVRGSGVPGGTAPIVIVGRRVAQGAPFRHISSLRPGQVVSLREGGGQPFSYIVERSLVVSANRRITEPMGGQALVLETSNPAFIGTGVLAVVARLSGAGAVTLPQEAIRLTGAGGSLPRLLDALALAGLLGVGWACRALWRPRLNGMLRLATTGCAVCVALAVWQLLLRAAPSLL
jgi:hypothetical protein